MICSENRLSHRLFRKIKKNMATLTQKIQNIPEILVKIVMKRERFDKIILCKKIEKSEKSKNLEKS